MMKPMISLAALFAAMAAAQAQSNNGLRAMTPIDTAIACKSGEDFMWYGRLHQSFINGEPEPWIDHLTDIVQQKIDDGSCRIFEPGDVLYLWPNQPPHTRDVTGRYEVVLFLADGRNDTLVGDMAEWHSAPAARTPGQGTLAHKR